MKIISGMLSLLELALIYPDSASELESWVGDDMMF